MKCAIDECVPRAHLEFVDYDGVWVAKLYVAGAEVVSSCDAWANAYSVQQALGQLESKAGGGELDGALRAASRVLPWRAVCYAYGNAKCNGR